MNQPRRSKLKFVREVYIKVKTDEKNYYFKEKVYSSRWDAFIDLINIEEAAFNKSFEEGKLIEVSNFDNTRLNIRNKILQLRRTS